MDLNKLTEKILRSETPGMRQASLVDAHHIVEDDGWTVSFVVYDRSPIHLDNQLQYERRWVVAIGREGKINSKTRGTVCFRWEEK